MPKRTGISSILIIGAGFLAVTSAHAAAEDTSWTVGATEAHPAYIEHKVDAATLSFYAEQDPDDGDFDLKVEVSVSPCDTAGTSKVGFTQGVFTYDDTVEARAIKVRSNFEQKISDALKSCDLPADFAQRALAGFGPAYREADAMLVAAGVLPLPDPFAFFDEPAPAPAQETESN